MSKKSALCIHFEQLLIHPAFTSKMYQLLRPKSLTLNMQEIALFLCIQIQVKAFSMVNQAIARFYVYGPMNQENKHSTIGGSFHTG